MWDLVCIGIVVLFFAVGAAFARACEKIGQEDS
jgi:hypothetical protein